MRSGPCTGARSARSALSPETPSARSTSPSILPRVPPHLLSRLLEPPLLPFPALPCAAGDAVELDQFLKHGLLWLLASVAGALILGLIFVLMVGRSPRCEAAGVGMCGNSVRVLLVVGVLLAGLVLCAAGPCTRAGSCRFRNVWHTWGNWQRWQQQPAPIPASCIFSASHLLSCPLSSPLSRSLCVCRLLLFLSLGVQVAIPLAAGGAALMQGATAAAVPLLVTAGVLVRHGAGQ